MATFLPGQSDQFGPLQLHTPDYSFLMQAYGAKQAQYDRGFNAVKNVYNSMLNSPVSSAENEEFRKNAFDKIQDSLKSVSGVDLSDPNTIRKAMGIMDPISGDKELAYDMAVTRYHQSQKDMMNQYKNSTDPEKRKLYNEQAERYLQLGEQDMRNARRGTGEITSVQPRDFVMFEDVMGFLNETANKNGLKIEKVIAPGDGYIYKLTNGEGAVIPFQQWATAQMGDRFDRQFQVMGDVQAETGIRNIVETQGVSKQRAREIFAEKVYQPMMEKIAKEGELMQNELKDVDKKLQIFESKYGTSEPSNPELLKNWTSLKELKKTYTDSIEAYRQRTSDFQNQGLNYVNKNLVSLFSEEAKNQNAMSWASTRAMATSSQDQKSDQVTISKWQMQNTRDMAFAQIQAADRRHGQAMEWNMHKFDVENQMDSRKQGFEEQKWATDLQYKYDALDAKSNPESGKGVSKMSLTGSYTSVENGLPGLELVQSALVSNNESLFNNSFNPVNGLLSMVVTDPMAHGDYYEALNKLKEFASSGKNSLTDKDLLMLKEYSKEVGGKEYIVKNRQSASLYLDHLSVNTFETARKLAPEYAKIKATGDIYKIATAYEMGMASVNSYYSEREQIAKEMKHLEQTVMDGNGRLKQQYINEGLEIVNQFHDGSLVFDTSKMSREDLKKLNLTVGSEFESRTNPVGKMYTMTGLKDEEVTAILNKNISKDTSFSGGKLQDLDFSKMPPADVRKLFSDQSVVSFNPVSKEILMEFKTSPANTTAKNFKISQPESMTVRIPYESAMLNPGLKRLAETARANDVNTQSAGKAAPFISNKFSHVRASDLQKSTGFDYSIHGITDSNGQYGVNVVYRYKNPEKNNEWETRNRFQPISNPDNPASWVEVNQFIDKAIWQHSQLVQKNEQLYRNQQINR